MKQALLLSNLLLDTLELVNLCMEILHGRHDVLVLAKIGPVIDFCELLFQVLDLCVEVLLLLEDL